MFARSSMLLLMLSSVLWGRSAAQTCPSNGTVVITISQVGNTGAFTANCNNGVFSMNLAMSFQVNVNGAGNNQPMAETGLPQIQMAWFQNNSPINIAITQASGVAGAFATNNVMKFNLTDDGPNMNGALTFGTCTNGQTLKGLQVAFSTTTCIVGMGFANPKIPAVTAIPTINNTFNTLNIYTGATNAPSAAPTNAPTAAPTTAAPTVAGATTSAPTAGAAKQSTNVTVIFTGQTFSPQCSNGQWALFGYGLQVAVSVNGSNPILPMAETGLGTYNMLFYINNVAAPVTVANSFNVGGSTSNGNAWTFSLLDDQPNIGANFFIGATGVCTTGTTSGITAAFSTSTLISGTQPATFTNILPNVVNNLAAANRFTGTGTTTTGAPTTAVTGAPTVAPTKAPTAATATGAPTKAVTTAPTTATGTKVVVTFSDAALFNPQCSNGKWALFGLGLQVTVSVNGGAANPPMAETGLGTYSMNFFINTQAAPVTTQSTFNVANPSTSGNAWTFSLMDDVGVIGGNILVANPSGVACVQGDKAPTIQASFSTTTTITGAAFTNVLPTLVNNLQPANQFTTTTGGTPTTTPAPTNAPTAATPSSTKVVVKFADQNTFSPQCNNGKWALFGLGLQVTVSVNGGNPNPPMAETGLGTYSMNFFINNQAAPVTTQSTFNVINPSTSGNAWTFSLMDDVGVIGGNIMVANPSGVACVQGDKAPTIQASFSTTTAITGAAFTNVLPTLVNALQTVNQFTGTSGTAPSPSATPSPTPAPTAGPGSAKVVVWLNSTTAWTPICSNNVWNVFGLTMQVRLTVNGMGPFQPMDETGLPTIAMTFFLNGTSTGVTVVPNGVFNVNTVSTSGAVWTFQLQNDQPSIGGSFALQTNQACTFSQTAPSVKAAFTSNVAVSNGVGMPPTIPAYTNSIPTVVNGLMAANVADVAVATVTSGNPSSSSSVGAIVGAVVGVGAAAGVGVLAYRRYKRRGTTDNYLEL